MKNLMTIVVAFVCLLITATTSAQNSTYRVTEYTNTVNPNAPARLTSTNIIIVGKPSSVRALSRFGGSSVGARPLAECGNYYKEAFGEAVNIYVAPIPLAAAYYTPNSARAWTKSHAVALNAMYAALNDNVKAVDIYSTLAKHVEEDIYSRTDHHWAPLGAYYAAEAFAKVAGVPFRDLSHYQEIVQARYVGSMHMYSKDDAVLASPEKFVYHKPKGVEYTTTYINFRLDSAQRIIGEGKPQQGSFFYNFAGGGAYCNFMGGDTKITQVRTSTKNGRRLVIVKDSFGNAIPGYLFFSFEEIHVIDFRYFNKNMKRYVAENKITDILLASNISFACSTGTMGKYKRFVVQ
jgi:hypothetical protein